MGNSSLASLRILFLLLLYLFFIRVVWAVVREVDLLQPRRQNRRSSGDGPSHLFVIEPIAYRGQSFRLASGLRIGRDPSCEILISDDEHASLQHAEIVLQDNYWCVLDLGSTNGTFLNSTRVYRSEVLRNNDRIQTGHTVFEVR